MSENRLRWKGRIGALSADDLALEGKIGTTGPGNDQFARPEGIAWAPGVYVIVADTGNHRIVKRGY